jgi:hypothetical protein
LVEQLGIQHAQNANQHKGAEREPKDPRLRFSRLR